MLKHVERLLFLFKGYQNVVGIPEKVVDDRGADDQGSVSERMMRLLCAAYHVERVKIGMPASLRGSRSVYRTPVNAVWRQ